MKRIYDVTSHICCIRLALVTSSKLLARFMADEMKQLFLFTRCKSLLESRDFSTGLQGPTPPSKSSFSQPPLSKPPPHLEKAIYAECKTGDQKEKTQITTLPNGLRVASENKFGQFCTIGGQLAKSLNYL